MRKLENSAFLALSFTGVYSGRFRCDVRDRGRPVEYEKRPLACALIRGIIP
jgi:hypothetical protein